MHAEVARLLALVYCARQAPAETPSDLPQVLRKPFEWMKLFYFQKISIEGLALLAGVSPGHFARLFRATFGTSPIDWLRRERISQAKRRLVEGTDSIKEIAEQVGYADRFFFSKDFKRHTGFSPREFREIESAVRGRAVVDKT
jgi:AraC-like DNA-binding protein